MKTRNLCCLMLTLSLAGISGCGAPVRFFKEPDVYSTAASDAVKLALFNTYGSVEDLSNAPRYPLQASPAPLPICISDEIRRINPKMIQTQCRTGYGFDYPGCNDINGCIRLGFHPTVRDDPEIWKVIVDAVSNPCRLAPAPTRQTGEHWHGLAYTLRGIRGVLKCDNGKSLPYSKVIIKSGEDILTINIQGAGNE